MDTRKSRMSMSGLPVFQYTGLYARISEAKNLGQQNSPFREAWSNNDKGVLMI